MCICVALIGSISYNQLAIWANFQFKTEYILIAQIRQLICAHATINQYIFEWSMIHCNIECIFNKHFYLTDNKIPQYVLKHFNHILGRRCHFFFFIHHHCMPFSQCHLFAFYFWHDWWYIYTIRINWLLLMKKEICVCKCEYSAILHSQNFQQFYYVKFYW